MIEHLQCKGRFPGTRVSLEYQGFSAAVQKKILEIFWYVNFLVNYNTSLLYVIDSSSLFLIRPRSKIIIFDNMRSNVGIYHTLSNLQVQEIRGTLTESQAVKKHIFNSSGFRGW